MKSITKICIGVVLVISLAIIALIVTTGEPDIEKGMVVKKQRTGDHTFLVVLEEGSTKNTYEVSAKDYVRLDIGDYVTLKSESFGFQKWVVVKIE